MICAAEGSLKLMKPGIAPGRGPSFSWMLVHKPLLIHEMIMHKFNFLRLSSPWGKKSFRYIFGLLELSRLEKKAGFILKYISLEIFKSLLDKKDSYPPKITLHIFIPNLCQSSSPCAYRYTWQCKFCSHLFFIVFIFFFLYFANRKSIPLWQTRN